jgi:phage terminase large subunit
MHVPDAMSDAVVTARFPRKLQPMFRRARYKVLWGGRGGGKSHGVATYLLQRAGREPTRVLCAREFQSSMRDSVHKLLSDMIELHRLGDRFEVGAHFIRHRVNGSEFLFEGLKTNITRIKSFEGIDVAWVEEAQNVSDSSWNVLIPTIRKDGSEIIITFNPELETDATYQRFVVSPPADAILINLNYPDNPWFPATLQAEMLDLKERDPDAYQHVYLGQCRHTLDGAIYARELREAVENDRIRSVPYDPTKPVNVYFDLGWADNTSMWFAQHIAGEVRLIDFHQDRQRAFSHYILLMQQRGYVIGTVFLPHDGEAIQLGTGRSIEEMARAAGFRVRIVEKLSVADGINAARTLFPTMFFDRERCADGLQALRHYRYDVDTDSGEFSRRPLHDHASHAADALRYCAVAMQERRRASYQYRDMPPRPRPLARGSGGTGWMRG